MYEYISGKITEVTPTCVIVETGGVGYFMHISLQSYGELSGKTDACLFVHQQIKEDAHVLYGFTNRKERELFRMLISVSGVGAATACLMLSALNSNELIGAIVTGNIAVIKSIKGIGQKTAERIIVDLKDKALKSNVGGGEQTMTNLHTVIKEAASALVSLGFAKPAAEKIVEQLWKENAAASVEELIKQALQRL
ncbi:Holliday junction ATP-dependent DNA helicase RuvA [Bacteroidia bacterium]|nr:Holliday junction ATP-dependent DNA helicase RuvA [Bacteroidia bacterium]GHT80702.1 Holliday junction ATP-dependent DNA helicase RuvA [Bacteroidia bacterium]